MQDVNYLVWQLIDSAFPSGGFAHSGGLEASLHHGHVGGAQGVRAFARQTIAQTGRGALPLVTAVHRTPGALAELDALLDVFLSNPVANRASRAQGRALVTSVRRSFAHVDVSSLEEQIRAGRLAGHHAPVFGAVFAALHVAEGETQRAFLFLALRGVTSAAVRLGLVGGYEAQEIQASLAPDIETVVERCGTLEPGAIAQTAPLVDLFQSTHDRLYSKLFQS